MDQTSSPSNSATVHFADLAAEIRMTIWELVFADIHSRGRILQVCVRDDVDTYQKNVGDQSRAGRLTFSAGVYLPCTTKALRKVASVNFETYRLMRKWLPDTLPLLNESGRAAGELWFRDGHDMVTLIGLNNCASLYVQDYRLLDPFPKGLSTLRSLMGPPHAATPSLRNIALDVMDGSPFDTTLTAKTHRTVLLTQMRFPGAQVYIAWRVQDPTSTMPSQETRINLLAGLSASSSIAVKEVAEICQAHPSQAREMLPAKTNDVEGVVQLAHAVRQLKYGLASYEVDVWGQLEIEDIYYPPQNPPKETRISNDLDTIYC